jgi:glycosyltransferase involved in cell wall biosynthesis
LNLEKECDMKCLKILVSVYACRPGEGSEPGVGWNLVRELVKYHDIWVLTRENNRPSIEAELAKTPLPLSFIYCDVPFWARWLDPRNQIRYYIWQVQAYLVARKVHRELNFDLVHHVTYVKYSAPSFLSLLPIPFIFGPVGGGESAPKSFWKDFSLRNKIYETLREAARWLGEHDPFVHLTLHKSTLIRATTDDTARRLHEMGIGNVQLCPESGLADTEIERLAQCPLPRDRPIRFIGMARLLHWKGFHLGLQAFAQADLPEDSEYWILGEGPEGKQLQQLAVDLEIASQVKFWGRLPRHETLQKLGECLALVHSSLHDSGGWVCLEAMAAGRPVICLNLGGPGVQITEETGFKIPAHTPEQVVRDMAVAMTTLAKEPELSFRMGQAGQKRVRERYSWTTRGHELAQLYEEILSQSRF